MSNSQRYLLIGLVFGAFILIAWGLVTLTNQPSSAVPSPTPIATATPDVTQTAGSVCPYRITKARVQLDAADPWKRTMSLNLDRNNSFRATAFQCGTDPACDDEITNVKMVINGAGYTNEVKTITNFNSIPKITVTQPGTITIKMSDPNYTGANCEDTATITVTQGGTSSPIPGAACPYVITKARAQLNASTPWSENLVVDLKDNKSIRLMGFQCKTNTACDDEVFDAKVKLNGAGFSNEEFTITSLNDGNSMANGIPTVPLKNTGTIAMTVTSATGSTDTTCLGSTTINVVNTGAIITPRPNTNTPRPTPKVLPRTGLIDDFPIVIPVGVLIIFAGILISRKYSKK